MDITPNLINELEDMSAFKLDNSEKVQIKDEISQMLGFMDKVKDCDIDALSYSKNNISLDDFASNDEVEPSIDRCDALSNAREIQEPYFTVPKVVD